MDDIRRTLTVTKLRIGRSRLSEYGGNLRVVNDGDDALEIRPQACGPYLFFYCLSDAAFRDETTGMPMLLPVASQFGLANATLVPEKCFVRMQVCTVQHLSKMLGPGKTGNM